MKTLQSTAFKAIADDTRLRVVNLFVTAREPLCVCEIVDALRLPQYQVSKHLTILKNAGLLDVEKDGTWGYHYLIEDNPLNKMLFTFLKKYLVGEVFDDDVKQLEMRLLLREEGRCVVGFVDEKDLLIKIKEKKQELLVKE
jgi:ArsR family transcriptional regulator, arsenate/arsenite/antimonite-responsive transcriptional repressor